MRSLQAAEDRTDRVAEATWGADPLEYLGGFRTLEYERDAAYYSSLSPNGTVGWSRQSVESLKSDLKGCEATLTIEFSHIGWTFLQSVYGWAALQCQAWARGFITIDGDESQSVMLFTDSLLEFWVDNKSYFGGDFYSYRRAPVVLHLDPGIHRIDLRLVRDDRAMGGVGAPKIQVRLDVQRSDGVLAVIEDQLLVPDMIGEKLASHLASIPVRNEGQEWIDIWSIESVDVRIDKMMYKLAAC